MKIVPTICSSPRTNNYIYRLIDTIGNIQLRIVVTGSDTSYLDKYTSNNKIEILNIPCANIGNDKISKLTNQFWNYKHCLSNDVDENDGVLILEDDVIFSNGWNYKFESIISKLKLKFGDRFILSLFTSLPLCTVDTMPDLGFLPLPIHQFYGTQGMYYTNTIQKEIIDVFNTYNIKKIKPYDLIIRDYLIKNDIPTFVVVPCLIQHIGRQSSWNLSSNIITAIIFNK